MSGIIFYDLLMCEALPPTLLKLKTGNRVEQNNPRSTLISWQHGSGFLAAWVRIPGVWVRQLGARFGGISKVLILDTHAVCCVLCAVLCAVCCVLCAVSVDFGYPNVDILVSLACTKCS